MLSSHCNPCLFYGLGPNVQNVATAVEQVYPLLFECQKPICKWRENISKKKKQILKKDDEEELHFGIS